MEAQSNDVQENQCPRERVKWEVADIFRLYGEAYRLKHALPPSHLKVMHEIEVCRTAYLGGHLEQCDSCGFQRVAYNSCRNRHCPKCQALTKARWLQARTAELLPVTYFHNVFTLPHELNPIILCNKKVIYNLLFKSASRTLLQFGKNPDNGLGGQLGFNAILHTWDQRLLDHFHLHCAIPGGVLSFDHTQWVSSREDFLFPVGPLSEVFRGKFTDYLKKAFQEGKLNFPGNAEEFATPQRFSQLLNQLWTKKWVVYSEEPFGGPQQVLDYLGRYTHRVAISNHRIVNVEQGEVSFKYRDRKDSAKVKIMTLEADEFIRRFLLHVLPDDFMRIRYFGFLANRCKREKLPICRRLLGLPPRLPAAAKKNPVELMLELTSIDITQCPSCRKGTMKIIAEIPKYSEVFLDNLLHQPQINDSS